MELEVPQTTFAHVNLPHGYRLRSPPSSLGRSPAVVFISLWQLSPLFVPVPAALLSCTPMNLTVRFHLNTIPRC